MTEAGVLSFLHFLPNETEFLFIKSGWNLQASAAKLPANVDSDLCSQMIAIMGFPED